MSDSVKEYPFPVWATQGGGLVQQTAPNIFVFVEAPPEGFGLNVGDAMPKEWDIIPANRQADEKEREDLDEQIFQGMCKEAAEAQLEHEYDSAMREYTHHGSDARKL
ncbi:MAG: hypothetical protein A2431_00395 [Candidatus Zambryskibacteria bacterium RIFOXYC1_FULL_39_10]|uniref:Uncharacterized protein n=1 Tax=Candidatus Zambryskibacteria bacterium RIFOXYC1_FULL_39_10 TaxID=1802779 RepID=A0A1G2UYK8_9BACT|nr:MAG: hypothetical protein A2431_00395 [Candidatus Zambryskibacteria bacterium RIFOXYC1_FULL_39_10]OHB16579.1 MAG: hypothetical protein A2605_04100 [Candidatus Zambryskibacteria bacterium RIFOXYD1_FULL_39_35]